MPAWDLRLEFAGYDVTIADVAVQWVERGSALKPNSVKLSVSAQVRVPYDFGAAVDAGHHPYTARGFVQRDGAVLLAGRVSKASWGARGEPVNLTLDVVTQEQAIFPGSFEIGTFTQEQFVVAGLLTTFDEISVAILPKTVPGGRHPMQRSPQRFTEDHWANIASGTEGVTHVVVFGAPGDAEHPGSPTYVVDTTPANYTFAIAAHRTEAQNVRLWFENTSTNKYQRNSAPLSVQHLRVEGRTVSTVDGDVSVVADPNRGQFYIDWAGGNALDGRAGEVMRVLMGHSSLAKDWRRGESALQLLNRYTFAGYINDDVGPMDYITRAVLPILPVTLQFSAEGMYLLPWPWLDGGSDVAFRLDADNGTFAPAGQVTLDDAAARSITLDYAYDPLMQQYSRTYTAAADTSYSPNRYAVDVADDLSIKTRMVWDDITAQSLVETRLRYIATQARTRRYTCDPDIYGIGGPMELRAGMPVAITDAGVSWSDRVAWVDEVERSGSAMAVKLRLREW